MQLKTIEELQLLLTNRPNLLLVCDLDGVIFDHRWRDFLIPTDPSRDENWDLWCQAAIKDDLIHNNVRLFKYHPSTIFLTSRSNKFFTQTKDRLDTHFDSNTSLLMRPQGVHTPSAELKVIQLKESCIEPDEEFFFVDDSLENVNAVNDAFPRAITFLMPY